MPEIYLSPSLQEFNEFLNGGSEEYYMNLIADAVEPYLEANGIDFTRNRPDMTLGEVINESNNGDYNLHLAIHSNAAPENLAGQLMGPDIYYYEDSDEGRRFAEILADNFKKIYPNAELVNVVPTRTLRELRRTNAPSALIEVAYHDNAEDEAWIKDNIDLIGETIAKSVAEYFGIPFNSDLESDRESLNTFRTIKVDIK